MSLVVGAVLIITSGFMKDNIKSIIISISLGQLTLGVFYIFYYFFERKNQYLTITDNQIIRNRIFPKKIEKSRIDSIKYHAQKYKLYYGLKHFTIDTSIIDHESKEVLKKELQSIDKVNK